MTKIQNCSASSYKKPRWLHFACILAALGGFAGVSGNAMADIQVVSTFKSTAVIGTTCAGGSTLISGGLTWTCPLTRSEADAAGGIGYQSTYDELGKTWVLMTWASANSYCTAQGGGYRLPSEPELSALYGAYPSNQMQAVFGWPTYNSYWSSTQTSPSAHKDIYLRHGGVFNTDNSWQDHVTCVR